MQVYNSASECWFITMRKVESVEANTGDKTRKRVGLRDIEKMYRVSAGGNK